MDHKIIRQIYIVILFSILGSCTLVRKENQDISLIEVKSHGEIFNREAGQVVFLENSVFIYSDSLFGFYIAPLIRTTSRKKDIIQTEGNDQEIIKKDTSYTLYGFKKGNKNCLKYSLENYVKEPGIILNLDSVLHDLHLDKQSLIYFNADFGKPINVEKSGNQIIEKYVLVNKKIGTPDTIFRFYDTKYSMVDFSFSPELDARNKSKLVKTAYLIKKLAKGTVFPDLAVPETMSYYEMKASNFLTLAQKDSIIKKFESDWRKLDYDKKQ